MTLESTENSNSIEDSTNSIKQNTMQSIGANARTASHILARSQTANKNTALLCIASHLQQQASYIVEQNDKDLSNAKAKGLDAAMLDRLSLDNTRIESMVNGLEQISKLPDPIGEISDLTFQPSGIQVGKMRVPLGVIGIIYESRPNVTADAAALCLKSGNAAVLRGGSEAIHSNLAIAECIKLGLQEADLPIDCVQVMQSTDRSLVGQMITANEYIDVIIPRGGKSLTQRIGDEASVAVIKHLDGLCHTYIDEAADIDKAIHVAYNAKARRYGICGAMETLLVHQAVATNLLPTLAKQYTEAGIELRGCKQTCALVSGAKQATVEDWGTEYLAGILSIKVVQSLDEALAHIAQHGSGHTDAIITEDLSAANRFLREVDSSSVMVNTSTQFADGFEYGLGAEIGISTNKLHVRGPVGLEGLTSQKYVVFGDGHARK